MVGCSAGQQLFAVGFGLDLLTLDDVFDDAFLVDEEGGANGAEVLAAVHRFLCPDAHLLHQRVVGVGDEGEGQLVLCLELLVAGGAVHADAHYRVAPLAQFAVVVAQAACLGCAAGGVVLGVEVENEFLSTELTEADLLSVLIDAQNFGRLVSNLHSSELLLVGIIFVLLSFPFPLFHFVNHGNYADDDPYHAHEEGDEVEVFLAEGDE